MALRQEAHLVSKGPSATWKIRYKSTRLQILSDVENSSDIEGTLLVKGSKRVCQIRWTNLPNAHKDQLVVRVSGQKHGKQLLRVLGTNLIPLRLLPRTFC